MIILWLLSWTTAPNFYLGPRLFECFCKSLFNVIYNPKFNINSKNPFNSCQGSSNRSERRHYGDYEPERSRGSGLDPRSYSSCCRSSLSSVSLLSSLFFNHTFQISWMDGFVGGLKSQPGAHIGALANYIAIHKY